MNLLALEISQIIPIVIAAIALVAIIAVLVFVIKLKKRKNNTPANKTLSDRELIEENAKSIESLIVLAKDNDALIESLKDLQQELKYLIPTEESKVIDYDKTIKNKIGDLRIALTKSDGQNNKKSDEIINEIKLAVADRNTKL